MIPLNDNRPSLVERAIDDDLTGIIVELTKEGENPDWEHAHSVADNLLCTTIGLLKPLLHGDTCFLLDHILAAYEDVGKWYA